MVNVKFLEKLALGCGAILALLGLIVIIGWFTQNVTLIQIHPSFVPMQFNTALCFLLTGIALMAVVNGKNKASVGLVSVAGIIGFLTLMQYLLQVNLGLDELFMEHDITTKTSHPGRMAPNTALSFLTCSIAIGIPGRSELSMRSKVLTSALVFALGFVAFIGYVLSVEASYGWGSLTRMALHTSIGFLIAGIGLSSIYWKVTLQEVKTLNEHVNSWTDGYAVAVALMIFSLDISLPLGIATGIMYVVIVLMSWNLNRKGQAYWYALLVTFCISLGYFLSPDGVLGSISLINRAMSTIVVWIVAALIDKVKKSELELTTSNLLLEKRVAERTKSLQEKNEEMGRIVYITSHDLQEPLRTTRGMIDIFIEDFQQKLDAKSERYLTMINSSVGRMSALVTSLLDYSRIGQKKKLSKVDLNVVINGVIQSLEGSITQAKGTVKVAEMPTVYGYETDLALLFQNLISNAIKFRKPGVDPVVEIEASEERDQWNFEVKDNGIGIEVEHRSEIFKIFTRLHLKQEFEGTGIGLAHCKKIVELHDGDISVVPSTTFGSIFKFSLSKKPPTTDE